MERKGKCPTMTVLLGLGKSKKYQYISGKEGATVYSAEERKEEFDTLYPTLSENAKTVDKAVLNQRFTQKQSFNYMTPGYEILRTYNVIEMALQYGYAVKVIFFPMTKEELLQEEISEQMPKYWVDELVECMPTALEILANKYSDIEILTL
jgi:predicted kinase